MSDDQQISDDMAAFLRGEKNIIQLGSDSATGRSIPIMHATPAAAEETSTEDTLGLVPHQPSKKLVDEILYNVNRKRTKEDELSADDVREVIDNLHYNGPFSPKAGAALPPGFDLLRDLVMKLAGENPGDMAAQARELLRRQVWYGMTDLEIEHGCSVLAKEAVAAIVSALHVSAFVQNMRR